MFCRKCGKEIPSDSAFCPKCGERVVTEDIEDTAVKIVRATSKFEKADAPATEEPGELICKECGKTIPKGNMFCPVCGTDVPSIEIEVSDSPSKKSKLKLILISAGALVAVLAVVFWAVILPEMHLDFYYDRDPATGDYIILGTEKDVKDLNIPDTIWFIPVRTIQDEAFKNSSVESVSFGKNIEEIGERAFESCKKLKSVEFRGSYENSNIDTISIGTSAFYNCSLLNNLTLPSINTVIGDGAFYKCKSLKRIYLGYVSRIGQISFGESGLTSLEVDCNVGMAAFGKCTDLNNVKISSWATLESSVFEGCTNLREAAIWTSTIPTYTFSMCSNLEKVYWNGSDSDYAEIGNYAFVNCSSLSEIVTYEDNVLDNPSDIIDYNPQIKIGEGAFDGCYNFKNANIAPQPAPTKPTITTGDSFSDYNAIELLNMTYKEFTSHFGSPEWSRVGIVYFDGAEVEYYGGTFDPQSTEQLKSIKVNGGKDITVLGNIHLGEHLDYYNQFLSFDVYDALDTNGIQGYIWYEVPVLFTMDDGRRYNVTFYADIDTFVVYAAKVSWAGGYGM